MDETTKTTTYSRNFLTQVVLRFDFLKLDTINQRTIQEFFNLLNGYNPPQIIEQRDSAIESLSAEDDLVTNQSVSQTYKIDVSSNPANFIEITPSSLVFSVADYINFTNFTSFYNQPLHTFFEKFEIKNIAKVSLRYINEILIDDGSDVYDWSGIIAAPLIANIQAVDDKQTLRRSMQNMHILPNEDTVLNSNYGLFNKTFPGPILTKEFILDLECYTPYGTETEDIDELITDFNKRLTAQFEKCIDTALRERMSHESSTKTTEQ